MSEENKDEFNMTEEDWDEFEYLISLKNPRRETEENRITNFRELIESHYDVCYEDFIVKTILKQTNEKERNYYLMGLPRKFKRNLMEKGFDKLFIECAWIYVSFEHPYKYYEHQNLCLMLLKGDFPLEIKKNHRKIRENTTIY